MRVYISAAIIAVLTLAGSLSGLRAQSLADIARREQERRKTVKPSGKVLTNKDLGAGSTAPATPPPAAAKPADAATTKPAEAAKPEEPGSAKDQAFWSGRMKELQTQLERDQTSAEAFQTRINSLAADFVNRDDPAQRATIARDRQRAEAELSRLTKAIADGKKAIADLEEEARKAGVPPGWLR